MTKARIHCVKPDTGAGMATVIFSLFSNAYYFDLVICQKKLSMFSFSPKPPGSGDSKVPEI